LNVFGVLFHYLRIMIIFDPCNNAFDTHEALKSRLGRVITTFNIIFHNPPKSPETTQYPFEIAKDHPLSFRITAYRPSFRITSGF
jgi:hypothetical protein